MPKTIGLMVPYAAIAPGQKDDARVMIAALAALSRDDALFACARVNTIAVGFDMRGSHADRKRNLANSYFNQQQQQALDKFARAVRVAGHGCSITAISVISFSTSQILKLQALGNYRFPILAQILRTYFKSASINTIKAGTAMKPTKFIGFAMMSFLALGISAPANAGLVAFTSLATFNAQGTITDSYGFEDWPSGQINFPGDPYTAHGVTYTSSHNEILGSFSGNNNPSAWIANANWTPLTGTIPGTSNMFAFDLGVFGTNSLIDYTITTNLGSYAFNDVSVPNLNTQLQTFFGYTAGPGEYFSGFSFSSQLGAGSGAALDNVTLGTQFSVPEPFTASLVGAGLVGAAALRRRKRAKRG